MGEIAPDVPVRTRVREGLLHLASWILYAAALVAVAATGVAAVFYLRVAGAAQLPTLIPALVIVGGGGAVAILCAAAGTALQVLVGVARGGDDRLRGRLRPAVSMPPVQPWPPATLIDLTGSRPADTPKREYAPGDGPSRYPVSR